jgi:hypothetical protein
MGYLIDQAEANRGVQMLKPGATYMANDKKRIKRIPALAFSYVVGSEPWGVGGGVPRAPTPRARHPGRS